MTTDEQLVQRMAAGDEQALVDLYRRYAPHLTALARQMLGNSVEADASVQAAFVQVWEQAGDFEAQQLSAKTWLLTQSHRLFRRHIRERELEPGNDPDMVVETGDDAAPAILSSPRHTILTESHDLLRCAFFQGSTDQMLADLTGKSVAEINQALRTALAQLSRDIKERNP